MHGAVHTAGVGQSTQPGWDGSHGRGGTVHTAGVGQSTQPGWDGSHGRGGTVHTAGVGRSTRLGQSIITKLLPITLCDKLEVMISDFIFCLVPFPLPMQLSIECLLTKLVVFICSKELIWSKL